MNRSILPLGMAAILATAAGCAHPSPSAQAPQQAETTVARPTAPATAAEPIAALPQTPAPFATPPVLPGTPDVATLAARVTPAVVNITTTHAVHQAEMSLPAPFGDFFGGGQRGRGGDRVLKQTALGSGFIIDDAGHVITNAHVIDGADVVKVTLADEREFTAKVLGKDKRLDVAVLQIEGAKDLPFASLGASDALRVGEYVVAIGNPFGLGDTVTMGIVSAKGREIGAGPYDDFIQTDASINPGNSGGPLFNLMGQVIGINTAINPQGKGIGFAIPIDSVKEVVPQLLATGHVSRGYLGVLVQPVDEPLAKALGLERPRGALVGNVEAAGPSAKAGIHDGDLIVAVDGASIQHSEELPRLIARHMPGDKVSLEVLRDGKDAKVDVTLGTLPDQQRVSADGDQDDDNGDSNDAAQAPPQAARHRSPLGIGIQNDPAGGVDVGRVDPEGPAADELRPGDVILEVNHQPVHDANQLKDKIAATHAGDAVLLKVKRDDTARYVAIVRQ